MRFTTALLPLLLSPLVTSKSLSLFGSQAVLGSATQDVPGENPLQYCQPVFDKDILTISYVNLSPNPPSKGVTLTIEAKGNFTEKVEAGATVNLQVKYGLIRLINQELDLCNEIKKVDKECPLDGDEVFTKDVDLPKEIPPGTYTVLADVLTADGAPITCLTATVKF
ncbi:Phosphatidylglycerol/phosphatidylinositol transfer protein [Toensbergia leucococca]|nr:Phosphatidylglycerol/phosphatidylinositol transfer protein [Toensbergia leucococca]